MIALLYLRSKLHNSINILLQVSVSGMEIASRNPHVD